MDDGKPPLISLALLLVFSFYLAFVETALASVSKNRIKISAERGDSRAIHALFALENFDRAITTILICNNIVSVSIATIVTVWVTSAFGLGFVSLSTIATTIVIFFACEMMPKSLAKKNSFKVMLLCADLLYILMLVCKPAALILTAIGNFASKHGNVQVETTVTEDELQDMVEDMAQDGDISEEESELISSAIQFGDLKADKILTPCSNIVSVDIKDDPEKIFDFLKDQTHSRIPVRKGNSGKIIGVLQTRKYMRKYMEISKPPRIEEIMDKVHYADKDVEIQDLLKRMSREKINMAVICDKTGKTLGIVTVEDILEELVGDIWDETDIVEEEDK